MCYIPDAYDKWAEHDSRQEEALKKLPECCYCGKAIQSYYCYEINGEIMCPGCLEENYMKRTEDLVM